MADVNYDLPGGEGVHLFTIPPGQTCPDMTDPTLMEILRQCRQKGGPIPWEHAKHIIAEFQPAPLPN